MKQVSKAIKSFVQNAHRYHSIPQRRPSLMTTHFYLLAGLVVLISSCQKDELHGSLQRLELQGNAQEQDLLNSSQKQDDNNKCVPFKGKFTFVLRTSTGTGTASHTGKFILVEPNNIVTPNAEGFLDITGPATITTANGDEIYATHVGLIRPLGNGTAQVNGEFTITGGTGRFAGATGSFEVEGLSNLALGTGSFTFEGVICY